MVSRMFRYMSWTRGLGQDIRPELISEHELRLELLRRHKNSNPNEWSAGNGVTCDDELGVDDDLGFVSWTPENGAQCVT